MAVMVYEKFCQSCSMPLEEGKQSGTESDGSKSLKYCHYCYDRGEFLQPDMTIADMRKILDETIGSKGVSGKFKAWMGKMTLPRLERWQNK